MYRYISGKLDNETYIRAKEQRQFWASSQSGHKIINEIG
jgi:hypothetical protein